MPYFNPQDKLILILATFILETVEEMSPAPVPEGPMYAAFQAKGIPLEVFQKAVQKAMDTGDIKRGPVAHTLVYNA